MCFVLRYCLESLVHILLLCNFGSFIVTYSLLMLFCFVYDIVQTFVLIAIWYYKCLQNRCEHVRILHLFRSVPLHISFSNPIDQLRIVSATAKKKSRALEIVGSYGSSKRANH
jgi:hypothetical protein